MVIGLSLTRATTCGGSIRKELNLTALLQRDEEEHRRLDRVGCNEQTVILQDNRLQVADQ